MRALPKADDRVVEVFYTGEATGVFGAFSAIAAPGAIDVFCTRCLAPVPEIYVSRTQDNHSRRVPART